MTKTTTHLLASLLSLAACGPPVDTGGAAGAGGSAPTGGAGGSGGEACACDCEPTAPSTHPLAYCEDPAHDALPCCRDDGTVGECSAGGCAPQACPDPSLGYDPTTAPIGPLIATEADVGGIVAAVLEPFAATTTCQTVVIGFATGPAPCEVPSAIEVVTFDTPTVELPPSGPATTVTFTLDGAPLAQTETPGIFEARFKLSTTHKAGAVPVVGAMVRENFCPALMPPCGEPSRAIRYRAQPPWKGWSKLADPYPGTIGTGAPLGLYFGLADCVATD